MRIAIVHYWDIFEPGGINRNILESSRTLGDLGNEVTIFHPSVSDVEDRQISNSVKVKQLPKTLFPPPMNTSRRFLRRLLSEIAKSEPQIIHFHSHMNLLSHSAINITRRRFKKIPIVFSPHFDISLSTKWIRSFFPLFNLTVGKRSLLQADHVVFNSEFEKGAYEKSVGKTRNSSIIAPGIDWEPIARDRKWNDELVLIFCGHAIKRKRPDRYVRLISELSKLGQKDGIRVRGKFASEGPEKIACMEKAEELGISEYIDWLPFLPREVMVEAISSADYFVLLSDSEAYGISVAEAISLGTPAIISNNTALTEFSSNRGVILIDKPDDMEYNAQKIISLRAKETRVETTAQTNIVTWDEMGEKLSNMYAETIHSKM